MPYGTTKDFARVRIVMTQQAGVRGEKGIAEHSLKLTGANKRRGPDANPGSIPHRSRSCRRSVCPHIRTVIGTGASEVGECRHGSMSRQLSFGIPSHGSGEPSAPPDRAAAFFPLCGLHALHSHSFEKPDKLVFADLPSTPSVLLVAAESSEWWKSQAYATNHLVRPRSQ